MSRHILLIAIGPVQGFIAQARRTRDLWFGSHLLSELARAGAKKLADKGAHLIFPPLEQNDPELEICDSPMRQATEQPPVNIANKLLAIVDGDAETVQATVVAVRSAVLRRWRDFTRNVQKKAQNNRMLAENIQPIWDQQIETFLEFQAVFGPCDTDADYKQAREQAEAELSSRKNWRDFKPWEHHRARAPKSSLDGARDSVLCERENRDTPHFRRYRITTGEQLDAVGLVKRMGAEPEQFVPLVNIALAPWIQRLKSQLGQTLWSSFTKQCQELMLPRIDRLDLAWIKEGFRFDAAIFLPTRLKELAEELGKDEKALSDLQSNILKILPRSEREPWPYVACLVADGDRMGKALDGLGTPPDHREFAENLAKFSAQAEHIITHYNGSLVYAGGDDVLAFINVSDAIPCADALSKAFKNCMKEALPHCLESDLPTLSVGIGVGHLQETMGDLLELGREAEKKAKGHDLPEPEQRNALAVILDKRSGGKTIWRTQWAENPLQQFEESQQYLSRDAEGPGLTTKKIYQIVDLLRRLPRPDKIEASDEGVVLLLISEVRRILARSERGLGGDHEGLSPEQVGLNFGHPPKEAKDHISYYRALHHQLFTWTQHLLITRNLMMAMPQREVKSTHDNA